MKKTFKQLVICTLIFSLTIFVISFLFSSLCKGNIIDPDKTPLILKIVSIPLFFTYAFFIGKIVKKRGLLAGIILTLVYLTISLILLSFNKELEALNICFIVIKCFSLICGTIIGVNKRTVKN